jgi:hypothetical protein
MKYNNEFLIKVKVNDFHLSFWYKYRTELKILGVTVRKEGVYSRTLGGYEYSKTKEIPNNHTLIDGLIYEKPECVLSYVDGSSKKYCFDSLAEAKEFSDKFIRGEKWV